MIKISKHEDGHEKLSIECYAVVSRGKREILVFLDETVPGWAEQLKKHEAAGFTIVRLSGAALLKEKKISFTKNAVIEKLDPYFMRESIDVIVRKLGF
jgi:hypothetical protein